MQPFIINKRTNFSIVKLIDQDLKFHDKVYILDAIKKATEERLDLVCFQLPSDNQLALCKILDYGKWKYREEKNKKKVAAKVVSEVKEIRFTPVIGDNDVDHKLKQVFEFLEEGHEVLMVMQFKGIYRRHFDIGEERMQFILDKCKDVGEVVNYKKMNNQIMVRMKKQKVKKEEK
jgi:translation initiation factor IF-3